MKKVLAALMVLLALFLWGCDGRPGEEQAEPAPETIEQTEPSRFFPDGDPEDVTCKGSYTADCTDAVVAEIGTAKLTNRELQAWYWAEVALWQQENPETGPDFHQPLDIQECQIDSSVHSWQQFFLRKALARWHSAQALVTESEEVPLPTEEAYKPDPADHETCLAEIPATQYLYGYNAFYTPNTLHQEYLDNLPDTLAALAEERGYSGTADLAERAFGTTEAALLAWAQTLNRGYLYFTQLSYYIEPTGEELLHYYEAHREEYPSQERQVDIRHILLVPEGETQDESTDDTCEQEAQKLLDSWKQDQRCSEATFANLANKHSADPGTALDGGGYQGIRQGQLPDALDVWCFAPDRQTGDTTVIRTEWGVHILYFSGSYTQGEKQAEEAYYREKQLELLEKAQKAYPMAVDYSLITLSEGEGTVSAGDVLYPDIAHERFPEVPLYLQQDYPDTMYGNYRIAISGCGITSLAMVGSYLTDEELTPPELCALFGNYSHASGTDGMLFVHEPATMGFYLREVCWSIQTARKALEDGHVVISLHSRGYWTQGGHYIVCESITQDGMVQVRDSDIYNYYDIAAHKEDRHTWNSIITTAAGFWIFEQKVTRIPACSRCGNGEDAAQILLEDGYLCRRCEPAVLRRDSYLKGDGK